MNIISPKIMWLLVILETITSFFLFDDQYIYTPTCLNFLFFIFTAITWVVIITISLFVHREAYKNSYATTKLVKSGLYKYVRHPMYLADILLVLGIMVLHPAPFVIISGFIAMLIFVWFMKIEDSVLNERFGRTFSSYKPKIFVAKKSKKTKSVTTKRVIKKKIDKIETPEVGESSS